MGFPQWRSPIRHLPPVQKPRDIRKVVSVETDDIEMTAEERLSRGVRDQALEKFKKAKEELRMRKETIEHIKSILVEIAREGGPRPKRGDFTKHRSGYSFDCLARVLEALTGKRK